MKKHFNISLIPHPRNLNDVRISDACKVIYLIISISICFGAHGRGQPILTRSHLSDLLEQPTVSSIFRAQDGILWIGTQQGLHRYDGTNLTVFNSDTSNKSWIPESDIKEIVEDSTGNLLIATTSGNLLKWNRKLQSFDLKTPFSSIGTSKLIRLLVSENGTIWLLSKGGLSVHSSLIDINIDWIVNEEILSGIGTPRDIVEDNSGSLWVAGDSGIANLLLEQQSVATYRLSKFGLSDASQVTSLQIAHENHLIIGTDNGEISVWDIASQKSLAQTKLSEYGQIYISRFLVHEDQIIIATDSGLYLSDIHLNRIIGLHETGNELSNPNIYSLLQDGKHVWIGTIDGLDILFFSPFEFFNSKNSEISNDILAFEEDKNGQLWVGTYNGLYQFDPTSRIHSKWHVSTNPEDQDQRITTIAAKGTSLWLGLLRGGVKTIDTITGIAAQQKLDGAKSGAITKIVVRETDGDILIATYDQGLYRISPNNTKSYYKDGSLPEKSITVLFQSNQGLTLAASANRIYQYTPDTDSYHRVPLNFGLDGKNPIIYSFSQTTSGDILVGTKDHGVFLWAEGNERERNFKVQPFGLQGELLSSSIYGIESDSDGALWCSTENGIVKLDSKGLLKKKFTRADGLQGNDFTLGASFTSKSGLIYFGGMNGYNRFDPRQIEIDSSASPMRLTDISLPRNDNNGKLRGLSDLKSLQLTYKDYFVTFQFSVLDFIDPSRNQYRYMLENFDTGWIENGTRNTATYTNLPAGNYTLRAQGANSAGIWNREGISIDLRVLPAPWYSWWAFMIYGLMLMLLVWVLHRVYHSYAIAKKAEQLALDMFETENRADDDMQEQLELQDEMVQSAYQHGLTTLSLISDFISSRSVHMPDSVKRDLTASSLRRISALASLEDCISYQTGGSIMDLHKFTDGLFRELLKDSPVNPETIITINEVTSMSIPTELASPIAIVIFELLENSIQHAFDLDSPANYIRITMSPRTTFDPYANFLELTTHDSGVGVPDEIEKQVDEGSGIAIVGAIIAKLSGSLKFSGEKGTLVTIEIPNNA